MSTSATLQVQNSYAHILKIAMPVGLAILIPQLNILTNTVFLGYYHPVNQIAGSQNLLAASGVAGIFYLMMAMTGYGLVSGIMMLMSRKAGEDDRSGMARLFNHGLWLALALSLVLLLLTQVTAPFLFRRFIHDEAVRESAIRFIRIRSFGLPFLTLCQMANSFFLSVSASRNIVYGTLVQTVTNILFDYLLIFGWMFIPELGLLGSAIASVLAEVANAVVALAFVFRVAARKRIPVRIGRINDISLMRQMLYKSSPLLIQYFLSIGAWEVFFIFVEHLGSNESALSQIFRSVFGLVGVAAWALASTCNSMVSNLIGQKSTHEVIPLIHKIVSISFSFAFLSGLPILLFPKPFLSLLTDNANLIETGADSLRIVVLATWMLSVSTIVFNGVVGTGKTRLNMIFESIAISFYLLYIFLVIEKWRMPLAYAWLSEFVYWCSLFLLSFFYFYSGYWKKNLYTEG